MSGYLSGSNMGPGASEANGESTPSQQLGSTQLVYDFANNDFRELMYVQMYASASANCSANAALKFVSEGVVDMVSAAGDICCGVNDVSGYSANGLGTGVSYGTGTIINKGKYMWITIRGVANPLLDASVAAGPLETGSSTPGQLKAWATTAGATFQQTNLQSYSASGAGGATPIHIY